MRQTNLRQQRIAIFKLLFLTTFLSFSFLLQAQVTIGFGEPPNKDALLDLKEDVSGSSTKGLLMPRIALNSTTNSAPLSNHVKGMFVFNTVIAGDVTPGMYFNDGTKWIRTIGESEIPSPIGTWFKQGTNELSNNNADIIWHQNKVSVGATEIPLSEPTATLFVDGDMAVTGKYYTTSSVYADYVFEYYLDGNSELNGAYEFKSLDEIKRYIYVNKHLPGVTAIDTLGKSDDGYTIDMTALLIQQLEKIEELYLHVIELNEKINNTHKEKQKLAEELCEVKTKLEALSVK